MTIQLVTQAQSTAGGSAADHLVRASGNGTESPPVAVQDGVDQRQLLDTAVASMQSFAQSVSRDLDFSVDEASGRVVVQVIDSESGTLIRQIPSEEVLKLAEHLEDFSSLLLRDRV
ncbi:MAG TPA: flaG [Pseudomonas sp.]|uniref:flagellar protein FlaG n=1 Tax=Stutzerimonas balearica TaxID=74829 RepID=UPI000C5D938F|nr:flaG [Pseudomonas sp.]HAF94310.1 flaG [Pseudomonas sp.]|tara:strand:- start:558 stop:905 length:348 start_codon:yes stop_codon:yes gene_type:complete